MTDPLDPQEYVTQALVESDMATRRATFARTLEHAPLDALTAAIRHACQRGFGHWQDPEPVHTARAGVTARPATHLFEISFLGLTAIGHGADEAARNWRRLALAEADARDEAATQEGLAA